MPDALYETLHTALCEDALYEPCDTRAFCALLSFMPSVIDLEAELVHAIDALAAANVPSALCGG